MSFVKLGEVEFTETKPVSQITQINELSFENFLITEAFYFILSALAIFIAYRFGFFSYPKTNASPKTKVWQVALAFLSVLLPTILIPTILHSLSMNNITLQSSLFWAVGLFQIAAALILAYIYIYQPNSAMSKFKSFALGFLTWLLVFPQFLFVVLLFSELIRLTFPSYHFIEQSPVKQLLSVKDNPMAFYGVIFTIVIGAPIVEEVLFRGFLQNWFRSRLSKFSAIALTSLIFAFLHVTEEQQSTNYVLVPALFLLSCYLGHLYEREKTLLASIGLHMAFNTISLMFILSQLSGS